MSSFVQIRNVLSMEMERMWESGKGEAFSKECGPMVHIPSFPHPGLD
jgi:hypothetical protein